MIKVTETVFKDDGTVEHTSERDFNVRSNFLNQFANLPGVSNWLVCELRNKNAAEFVIDGVKRKIEITPKLILASDEK